MTRFKIQMEVRPVDSGHHTAWKRVSAYVSAFNEDHALAIAGTPAGMSVRDWSKRVINLDSVE